MKRFFWLICIAALCLFFQPEADSQISITTADLPNYFGAGNSLYIYSSKDSATMNVGTASNSLSQTWTAPPVIIRDSARTDDVVPSSTPYIADFPGAAYAQKLVEADSTLTFTAYYYYKVSSDSLIEMGIVTNYSGTLFGSKIDTTDINKSIKLYFKIPLQMGVTFNSSGDTIDEGGGIVSMTTNTTTVDAYGTLNIDNGSFGALRTTTTSTSNVYYGGSLLYGSTTYGISWYTKEGYVLSVDVNSPSSGTTEVYSPIMTYPGKTPSAVKTSPDQPTRYTLAQNYPNPFNPSTAISYQLSTSGFVTLKVYNVLGSEMRTLVNKMEQPGRYEVRFDATDLPSGAYFYRLTAGTYTATKKMMVIR